MQPIPPPQPKAAIVHRTRADDVYDLLKRDIAEFHLVPGDRFTEGEISERLGVSRTPVRQALFRLQQEGYVEVLFRSGWRVLPFDFKLFEQLYDFRLVLETEAVRRLCTMGAEAARQALAGLEAVWLVPPDARSTDMAQVGRWDEAFHCSLLDASGNAEMARAHREVTDRIRIIRRLDFTKKHRVDTTYEEHARILRAILAQRSDEACRLLAAHIGASHAEVRKITLHEIYEARHAGRAEAST
ncbi:MAG TPA: GntR family transcriptional regulator [Bordetella sp.]